jgi:hypothetical protein
VTYHDRRDLSFEEKCDAMARQIDKGEVPSPLALARALDLPLKFVEGAIAHASIEFFRQAGGRKHS